MACFIDYSQYIEMLQFSRIGICYENVTETWFRDMYKNSKLCIVMKMVWGFLKKWTTSYSSDFIIEINKIKFVDAGMLKKMLEIVFSINICTLHRISSNVDLNICAHTWHSGSVLGHKQGFEHAVPEILVIPYPRLKLTRAPF